ncbi:MAG: glycosyltransferase [Ignavibacteriaceae bacterium]|nr:glycosyltransferase [Ignavibacteriaceae bacterium]
MQINYPPKVIEYLGNKSSDKWNLEWVEVSGIENVIVIPAICEYENIKKLLTSLAESNQSFFKNTIIIFVINNSESSVKEVKEDNKSSLHFLRKLIKQNSTDNISKKIIETGIRIGLIDAATEGKEFNDNSAGVGLARKTGMDSALRIFDYSIPGKKIIISLDADCQVEKNYLSEIINYFNVQNVSVAVVDFEHNFCEETNSKIAILSYEIFLRHYVAGLLFAGSPFAFHTIGSTVVCDHEAYIKIGGMNTKKAAEDFYFLQKLAKHYRINRITSTKVKLSARQSWRVPFGTGRSITDFLSNNKIIKVFDPEVYLILKEWLVLFNSDLSLNPDLLLQDSRKIHPELNNFLGIRGFRSDWQKILDNSKSKSQLDYQRKNWFDAFETLKLIHHLRDTFSPMMDITSGTEKLFKIIQHSVNFGLTGETINQENLFEFYLNELKSLENKLYKNFY